MHYIYFFGLQIDVNPVAFSLPFNGGWNVYWYGIIITLGFLAAVIYGMKRAKSFGIDPDKLLTAIIFTAVLAILCGRLYYVIFDANMNFSQFINIHDGGMAIPGAILGAVGFGALFCKIEKIDILSAFDLMAIGFFIGQCVGRWGNFINQEAYGTFTGSSWFGMTGDVIARDMGSTQLVHPCFFYESIWCLLGFVLLHVLSYRRKFKGELGAIYMIWYGFGRFIIEGLRTDALTIGNARVTQWLMAAAVVCGIILLILGLSKVKNPTVRAKAYSNVFDSIDEEGNIIPKKQKFVSDEEFVNEVSEKNDSDNDIKLNTDAIGNDTDEIEDNDNTEEN